MENENQRGENDGMEALLNYKGPIIEKTSFLKISPIPSLPKRDLPPFAKGRDSSSLTIFLLPPRQATSGRFSDEHVFSTQGSLVIRKCLPSVYNRGMKFEPDKEIAAACEKKGSE